MSRLHPALLLLSLLGPPLPPLSAAPTMTATIRSSPADYTWKNVNISGGGFITGIVPHPAEIGLMYAPTDVGGAYRWDPSARRWQPITEWINGDSWTLTGIESIGLDPTDPNRVYLAAGSYTNNWSGNGHPPQRRPQGEDPVRKTSRQS